MPTTDKPFIPHIGLEIPDCYMSGLGPMESINNPGVVEAVGTDWMVVRDKINGKPIFVVSSEYPYIRR